MGTLATVHVKTWCGVWCCKLLHLQAGDASHAHSLSNRALSDSVFIFGYFVLCDLYRSRFIN